MSTWLDQNLSTFSNLKILSIQSNRITKMENLEGLVSLEELYLSHNGLTKLEGLEKNVSAPSTWHEAFTDHMSTDTDILAVSRRNSECWISETIWLRRSRISHTLRTSRNSG
jgi:Leucine-rich repeat (LRR) protein